MSNRGVGRARLFVGGMVLFAAVIAWFTGLWLTPINDNAADGGTEIRETVVIFMRNSALGTLILAGLAAWLLVPVRRPNNPWRDRALIAVLLLLVGGSLYQLVWLRTAL